MPILETRGLTKRFGGLLAVNNVDLTVEKGEIFAMIGPNGAGKTTMFNLIAGLYKPTSGQIIFNGHSVYPVREFWRTYLPLELWSGVSRTGHSRLRDQYTMPAPAATAIAPSSKSSSPSMG